MTARASTLPLTRESSGPKPFSQTVSALNKSVQTQNDKNATKANWMAVATVALTAISIAGVFFGAYGGLTHSVLLQGFVTVIGGTGISLSASHLLSRYSAWKKGEKIDWKDWLALAAIPIIGVAGVAIPGASQIGHLFNGITLAGAGRFFGLGVAPIIGMTVPPIIFGVKHRKEKRREEAEDESKQANLSNGAATETGGIAGEVNYTDADFRRFQAFETFTKSSNVPPPPTTPSTPSSTTTTPPYSPPTPPPYSPPTPPPYSPPTPPPYSLLPPSTPSSTTPPPPPSGTTTLQQMFAVVMGRKIS